MNDNPSLPKFSFAPKNAAKMVKKIVFAIPGGKKKIIKNPTKGLQKISDALKPAHGGKKKFGCPKNLLERFKTILVAL